MTARPTPLDVDRPKVPIGCTFGRLYVQDFAGKKGGHNLWLCSCECGGSKTASTSDLRAGRVKSCGCLHRELSADRGRAATIDLTSRRFGRWTVSARAENDGFGQVRWLCRCECGHEAAVRGNELRSGSSRGCIGCRSLWRIAHGHAQNTGRSPTYSSWAAMLNRCHNPNTANYQRYGGRGIVVCERWRTFENFLSDMGDRPSRGHSIDRIDNERGYEPGNCRWATAVEQRANQRPRRNEARIKAALAAEQEG